MALYLFGGIGLGLLVGYGLFVLLGNSKIAVLSERINSKDQKITELLEQVQFIERQKTSLSEDILALSGELKALQASSTERETA